MLVFVWVLQEASEIFEFQKANLRSKMIGDWTAKIKRLEDEREGNSAPEGMLLRISLSLVDV
jgi:hypothetical protein